MPKTPSYRQRKGYDQALVTLTDSVTKKRRDYWLGVFNSQESRERYHRVIAEWEANGRRLPSTRFDRPVAETRSVPKLSRMRKIDMRSVFGRLQSFPTTIRR